MKIEKIVKAAKIRVVNDGKNIMVSKKASEAEINFIRQNKEKIIEHILNEKKEKEKRAREQKIKEYVELESRLPEIEIKSLHNDEKAQKFIVEANKVKFYDGAEMDGVNIAQDAKKQKLFHEAQKYCEHELETEIYRTHTQDARKKIIKTIRCAKCSLEKSVSAEERVTDEAMMR